MEARCHVSRWARIRRWLARWWPDGVQGVGMSVSEADRDESGELPVLLDVEGRTGVVYLSRVMWLAFGAEAGWVSHDEVVAAWREEADQGHDEAVPHG